MADRCQRWRDGRPEYRPAGEPINTRLYEVAAIAADNPAKAFVQRHHYSGSYPAARRRAGLFRGGELVGVAVFSEPMNRKALSGLPGDHLEKMELGRFVLRDDVPANGESWFLAQAFRSLRREGFVSILAASDPVARHTADGQKVFPGHIGTIYQATNAAYLGRATARTLRVLPDGQVFSDRAISKVRAGEVGWRYASEVLYRFGATQCPDDAAERRAWLGHWLPRLTTRLRHAGNHRYGWCLDKRRSLPPPATGACYPKHLPASCWANAEPVLVSP